MKVISVNPLNEYKLQVTFDDGVSGVIDLKGFIGNGVFSVLQNQESFNKVYTNGYLVAWDDDLEIDSLAIYAELLNKEAGDILADSLKYAAN